MYQKGTFSPIALLIIVVGLVVGVYFVESGTGFFSKAWDVVGPSKSATIKIPFTSPNPSNIATSSATPAATSSAKPKTSPSASASASLKPSPTASASAKLK